MFPDSPFPAQRGAGCERSQSYKTSDSRFFAENKCFPGQQRMSCPSFGRELLRRRDLDRRELEALQEAFEALHFDGPAKGSPRHASDHSIQRLRGRKPVLPSGHFDMKLNTIRVDGARSAASA